MGVKEDIISILADVLDVKPEELKEEKSLYDSIGVDSTEMVEVRVALKKRLGVEILEKEITNKQPLKQIIELVEKKLNANN
ncbi:MAG: phosphopantetheine-binding protein [Candidatus Omnitrophica bacterium]|nr:phosphopantetheine-binding protein [Candidatus Omnitrophota bacterium]MCM8830639.1 phosphopantetheine-binding protein [Candidatus Omnitrophota bacterium]